MNDDLIDDEPWTAVQQEQLIALARNVAPGPGAEAATANALLTRGLLRHPGVPGQGRVLRWGLGIAAALVVFAGGTMYGRALGRREVTSGSAALDVQRAGSAYVDALVRLSQEHPGRGVSLAAGLEAGASTLRAAATTVAERDPRDWVARRIATRLTDGITSTSEHGNAVIWF